MGTKRPPSLFEIPRSPSDEEIARPVVSEHYANRVTKARAELERVTSQLRGEVEAAEAAQRAWEQDGEITCGAVGLDPYHPELVAGVRFGIQLAADRPATEAWQAAMAAPGDSRLRAEYAEARAKAQAVERWLHSPFMA